MSVSSARTTVEDQLKHLKALVSSLPSSVPSATEDGCIATVFNNIPESEDPDDQWPVFNHRMDALFGEDLRENGRLLNVKRGPFGMDMVVQYAANAVRAGNLLWEPTKIKLDRLLTEVRYLSKHTNPKTKLTLTIPALKRRTSAVEEEDEDTDLDYAPPKRPHPEPKSPTDVFNSQGEEETEHTNLGERLQVKHPPGVVTHKAKTTAKGKDATKTNMKKAVGKDSAMTDESDGGSALQALEVQEQSQGARRGPANGSLRHFHDPVPVLTKDRSLRWEFKCKYCPCLCSVVWTVSDKDMTFDDEPKLPKLNNLASHASECKKTDREAPCASNQPFTHARLNIKQSADLMAEYLKAGKLNPAIMPTQKGFLRLFSAWILDESLPWTTGKAPSLDILLKYLKVKFILLSDTTVRNQLGKIFLELHGKVVHEFVNVKSRIAYATDTWTTRQMVYTFACTIGSFDKEHEGLYAGKAFMDSAFLAAMDKADSPDNNDYFLLHKESSIHYDPDGDEDHIAMEYENVDLEAVDADGDEVLDITEEKAIEDIQHSSPLKRVFNLSPDLLVCTYSALCLAALCNDKDCIITSAPCQIPKLTHKKYAGSLEKKARARLMVVRDVQT
ncbi:hypothetical protein F5148DRAFT_1290930 [Russula earlei]|uniref:Uncharacterized protein n=1 Tax=Russula earlei TaxID=71964 RepID=A0ACC0TW01_9AGAM|nr:hypothetical protein F5148DRAFT_1290930 [Russula earlei]